MDDAIFLYYIYCILRNSFHLKLVMLTYCFKFEMVYENDQEFQLNNNKIIEIKGLLYFIPAQLINYLFPL